VQCRANATTLHTCGGGFEAVKSNAAEADRVAKQTNHLAAQGGSAVQKSVEAMELIRTSSGQIGEIIRVISEIAAATVEQAANAQEVAKAIQSVSSVTEQSAAGSEEMASSSEELGAQAAALRELVVRFKT